MKVLRNIYSQLLSEYDRKEVSILLGPRQVGKTFLLQELHDELKKRGLQTLYFNLEIPAHSIEFNKTEAELFEMLTSGADAVFIDEFHYLKNASKLFKAIYDSRHRVKIYASGSSSIEIHKHLKESLAGRRLVTKVFPLSFVEYQQACSKDCLHTYLLYGGLPGIIHFDNKQEKIRILNEIVETYIQKDIKSLIKEENIRAFNTLLYLLAENQGGIVSVNSLASEVGLTSKAVAHHISILENTYVIYSLHSYAKNLGNELKKSKKYYLYDMGIRNSLLKDFSVMNSRSDSGALHESFIMNELVKQLKPNMELKFWRTKQGDEVDFVLLINRKPFLIEVKSQHVSTDVPAGIKKFLSKYGEASGAVVFSRKGNGTADFMDRKIHFLPFEAVSGFVESIEGS